VRFLVFTDVDGTLLDHSTYSHKEAESGIQLLREKGIPLILVSSKTLPEIRLLQKELALTSPFVFENGGGIVWPGREETVDLTGMNTAQLKKHAALLNEVLHEKVRLITDMSAGEIEEATGLTRERARLSQQRAASLPFIFESKREIGSDELERLNNAMNPFGLLITKGGRFFHLLSKLADKGIAVKKIIAYYDRQYKDELKTIGIGDSENDIAMFKAVDIPVIVRKPDGSLIKTGLSDVVTTRGIGPLGFTEAVRSIIMGEL
jgi:mannosyl-3-phosphoglycerate phosphatase